MLTLALITSVLAPTGDDTAVSSVVRSAIERYDALDYDEVVPLLEIALSGEDLPAGDRLLAHAYLGRVHAVFGRERKAVTHFVTVLEGDPEFSVSDYESPVIRQAVERAEREVERRNARRERAVVREAGSGEQQSADVEGAALPAESAPGDTVVEAAVAPEVVDRPLTTAAVDPDVVLQHPEAGQPIPWPWIIAGATAVLTAMTVTILLVTGKDDAPVGTLGRWEVR